LWANPNREACSNLDQRCRNGKDEEEHTQPDADPEQNFFYSTSGSEYTTRIAASQTAQSRAFALEDDADD